MSEPTVLAHIWQAVMQAAGYRCQCTRECGSPHKQGDGRCPRVHDSYASKHRGPVHLLAAPADPATPALTAARLPAAALRAWCPTCHDGARRAANRTTRSQPDPAQGSLFAL